MVPEADAGAAWYGYPPQEYVDPRKIRIPLMAAGRPAAARSRWTA